MGLFSFISPARSLKQESWPPGMPCVNISQKAKYGKDISNYCAFTRENRWGMSCSLSLKVGYSTKLLSLTTARPTGQRNYRGLQGTIGVMDILLHQNKGRLCMASELNRRVCCRRFFLMLIWSCQGWTILNRSSVRCCGKMPG